MKQHLLFTDNGYWLVREDYTKNAGGVESVKSGQPLHGIKWKYYTSGEFKDDDDTLSVTGIFMTWQNNELLQSCYFQLVNHTIQTQ